MSNNFKLDSTNACILTEASKYAPLSGNGYVGIDGSGIFTSASKYAPGSCDTYINLGDQFSVEASKYAPLPQSTVLPIEAMKYAPAPQSPTIVMPTPAMKYAPAPQNPVVQIVTPASKYAPAPSDSYVSIDDTQIGTPVSKYAPGVCDSAIQVGSGVVTGATTIMDATIDTDTIDTSASPVNDGAFAIQENPVTDEINQETSVHSATQTDLDPVDTGVEFVGGNPYNHPTENQGIVGTASDSGSSLGSASGGHPQQPQQPSHPQEPQQPSAPNGQNGGQGNGQNGQNGGPGSGQVGPNGQTGPQKPGDPGWEESQQHQQAPAEEQPAAADGALDGVNTLVDMDPRQDDVGGKKVDLTKLAHQKEGDIYNVYYKDDSGALKPGYLEMDGNGGYKIKKYGTDEEVTSYDKESILVRDENAYRTVADQYATLTDTPETTSKLHGIGSRDRNDIHDHALEDFTRPLDGQTVHKDEGIMWHTHVTQKTGSSDRDDEQVYLPGQKINLSTNPEFRKLVSTYKDRNVFGDLSDKTDLSRAEFIATYASTGQYSVKDLRLTADALQEHGIQDFKGKKSKKFFYETEFKDILKDLGETDWDAEGKKYEEQAANLKKEFQAFHDQINEWSGTASEADKATLQCINGKFEVTMGNIEKGLLGACDKAKDLKKKLEELQATEEAYIGLQGETPGVAAPEGFSGNYVERNIAQIKKELEEEKDKKIEQYDTVDDYTEQENPVTHEKEKVKSGSHQVERREYKDWQARIKTLEDELAAAEEALAKLETQLEELMEDVLELYYDLKNLETTTKSFSDYFNPEAEAYRRIHGEDGKFDLQTVLKSHDDIVDDFEDYSRMPVITNLSDYNPGDVIAFDDAHGYVYAVTGAFDPLSGTIKIACFDKDGRQVGSDISIWDQREIVPIKYVREYDHFYEEYPDTFPMQTEPVETVPLTSTPPGPTPHTTTPPGPTPHTTTPHTTTPHTTTPSTTTPGTTTPGTTTPGTTTPGTTTPGTTTPAETTPYIPVYTVPWSTIVYTGGPDSPHTGLDAIYGTGDTKQSAAGLGALAGLAAGAAGLGLTGLIGDKKDEDEEEEDEAHEMVEEKPEAEKDPSNPQFF